MAPAGGALLALRILSMEEKVFCPGMGSEWRNTGLGETWAVLCLPGVRLWAPEVTGRGCIESPHLSGQ